MFQFCWFCERREKENQYNPEVIEDKIRKNWGNCEKANALKEGWQNGKERE